MKTLYIRITEDCNMNCPFCYVKKQNGHISIDSVKKICNQFDPNEIIFHGGEPLLYPNLCIEIINMFKDKNFSITSNLTLPLTDERLEIIKKCHIATSFSVDRFKNANLFLSFTNNVYEVAKIKDITFLVTLSREQLKQSPEELNRMLSFFPCKYIKFERLYENKYDKQLAEQTDIYLKKLMQIVPREKNVLYQNMINSIKMNIPVFSKHCSKNILTLNTNGTLQICPNMNSNKIQKKREIQEGKNRASERKSGIAGNCA